MMPQLLRLLQVVYWLACGRRIFYFRPRTGPDIAADVDHINLIGHINLTLVHIIEHLFGALSPNLIVAGVPEQANADDNVPSQRKALLGFQKCVFESGAPAERDDFILSNRTILRVL